MVINWCILVVIGGLAQINNPSGGINQLVTFFSLMWRAFSGNLGTLGWAMIAEIPTVRLGAQSAGVAAAGAVFLGLVFSTSVPYMLNANYANCEFRDREPI
jgi:SP family general alpha glucoside:H+ symporter-like MFS transporter